MLVTTNKTITGLLYNAEQAVLQLLVFRLILDFTYWYNFSILPLPSLIIFRYQQNL